MRRPCRNLLVFEGGIASCPCLGGRSLLEPQAFAVLSFTGRREALTHASAGAGFFGHVQRSLPPRVDPRILSGHLEENLLVPRA